MFRVFERLIDPYPEDTSVPPPGLRAFYWTFLRPVWRLIAAVSVMSAMISVAEVLVFGFMGKLVDWLGKSTPRDLPGAARDAAVDHGGLALLVGLPPLQGSGS